MPSPAVLYEKDGPLAVVSLNRPTMRNAYNVEMRDDLYEILQAVRDDPEVRVMILRGEGPGLLDRWRCVGVRLSPLPGSGPRGTLAPRQLGHAAPFATTDYCGRPRLYSRRRDGNGTAVRYMHSSR